MKFVNVPLLAGLVLSATTAFVIPSKPNSQRPSLLSLSPSLPSPSPSLPSSTELRALPSIVNGAIQTASSATDAITSSALFEYFLQTVISYAVPAFFAIIVIFFASASFRKRGNDEFAFDRETAVSELYSDLYGDAKDARGGGGGFSFGPPRKPSRRNLGIPASEYLTITHLNERYDSYDFSLAKATQSKAVAASKYRSRSFDRALQLALAGDTELPAYAKTQLLEAEKNFLRQGKALQAQIQQLEAKLAGEAMDKELKRLGMEQGFEMDPKDPIVDAEIESSNTTTTTDAVVAKESKSIPFFSGRGKTDLLQTVSKLQRELKQVELDFLQAVIAAVGTKRGLGIRAALLGDIAGRGSGGLLTQLEDRPLSAILQAPESKKSLFVMQFPGDIQASQLNGLREEVTAIIRNAKPGDEALVVLQSGGGTVTGYGLAAGQLVRLKEAGLFLTMAVEQVAASGGYMMACVADRIVASPFAVLGSIGVISEIPNAYERLKQEGMYVYLLVYFMCRVLYIRFTEHFPNHSPINIYLYIHSCVPVWVMEYKTL